MNRILNPTLLIIPEEAMAPLLTLFLILGGFCLMIGWRGQAAVLIITAISTPFVMAFADILLTEVFASLPEEMVRPVSWVLLGIMYLMIFGALMTFVFGERLWKDTKSRLLADALRAFFGFLVSWPLLLVWVGLGVYVWLQ